MEIVTLTVDGREIYLTDFDIQVERKTAEIEGGTSGTLGLKGVYVKIPFRQSGKMLLSVMGKQEKGTGSINISMFKLPDEAQKQQGILKGELITSITMTNCKVIGYNLHDANESKSNQGQFLVETYHIICEQLKIKDVDFTFPWHDNA